MRKLLLPLLLLAFAAPTATAAVIHEGGDLIAEVQGISDPFAVLGTQAIVSPYSNLATFLGAVLNNGGTTPSGAGLVTVLVADDLSPLLGYAGVDVTSFKWTVTNLNSVGVGARCLVRFYAPDGPGGAPGTLLGGFNFNPLVFAANAITTVTANLPPATLQMFGGPFWSGLAFDNNGGATGATAAQFANMGQGAFNPPTAGTSTDQVFRSADINFSGNNPAGGIVPGSGQFVFNLGWQFNVDQATPAQVSSWGRLKSLYR